MTVPGSLSQGETATQGTPPRSDHQKVCFICGTGHSGSTLLGLILGSHADCFYAGEAAKARYLGNEKKSLRKRICKLCGPNCPIWSNLDLIEQTNLYQELSAKTGKPIVIDSAKGLDWLNQQLTQPSIAENYLIFLQRDGRAVLNSRVRKYPQEDRKKLIQDWVERIQETRELFQSFQGPKIEIRYEVLATQPEATIQKLCHFLGISYQPEMLEFYRHEHHPLGGNDGTQFLVSKAQDEIKSQFLIISDRRKSYYENHELGITLDLRWKSELDSQDLDLFEALAGQENQDFRWEPDEEN